jgi:hypothetical protein
MITVNSISGGKTSSYMAVHYPADINVFAVVCIDYAPATPKDPTVLKYCLEKLNGNFIASAEDEKSLKIMMQLEQLIGKNIVWVRGKSFDNIITDHGILPTWVRRFCTTEMKVIPIFEYVYFRYGVINNNIGYRYDEFHRAYKTLHTESIMEMLNLFGDIQKTKEHIKKTYRKVESVIKDYPLSKNTFGERNNNLSDVHWANMQYPMIDDRINHKEIIDFWKVQYPEFEFPADNNCKMCHHKSKWQISATTKQTLKFSHGLHCKKIKPDTIGPMDM